VIFVTVGTQLPFERLVGAVEEWAARQSPRPDVLAQVGGGRVDYPHLRCVRTLDGRAYADAIAGARLLVAHAGTGSILTALDCGVPVILLPRDAVRGEHRDDHQMQTARQMERMGLVTVAWSEHDLASLIDREMAMPPSARQPRVRNSELVEFVGAWVRGRLGR
jgi:UDP-N-acetylglucosamine transferase subunit ALG13